MNISNIVGALFPIFFVLALGYLAGKRHTFDADQAAGFSKLALSFALPASLFVSMTSIPRDLLLIFVDPKRRQPSQLHKFISDCR
jgi:malonate transporter